MENSLNGPQGPKVLFGVGRPQRRDRMKKIMTIFVVLAAVVTTTLCGGQSDTLATFDGGSITQKDVEKNNEQEFYEIRQKEFQIRQQAAFESARERIFEAEAKKRGMTVEKFVESEMAKRRSGAVTEEGIRQFYENNKGRINQPFALVKDRIRQQLINNQEKGARDSLTSELLKQYNFKFTLKEPQPPVITLVNDGKPFWGKADAKVVITEFSDLECYYCRKMQPAVQRIKAEYSGKIKWVFRHFPLISIHAQAIPAHIASVCAGKQNKYFEFQSLVFALPEKGRSPDMSPAQLANLAQSVGLNMPAYQQCFADKDGQARAIIDADFRYGEKIGVRGTPAIYINGVHFQQDASSYDALKEAIEKLLNS